MRSLLALLLAAGPAAASPITLSAPDGGFPILASTTYPFTFIGAPAPLAAGTLRIEQTNGDFNNAGETITVAAEGNPLGTFTFATDNASPFRTLALDIPLPLPLLTSLTADGVIGVSVTTSADVNQSVGSPGFPNAQTSFLRARVSYDAAPAAVPEPATLAIFGGLALAGAVGYRRRKAGA